MPSTGTIKGKILIVDFPDAQAQNDRYSIGMDPQILGPRMLRSVPFLDHQSFGRLTMDITVHPKVIRAKFPSRSYFASWGTFNSRIFMSEILLAVDAEEDFAGVQIVYFVVPTLDGSFTESYALNDNIVNAIPIDGARLAKFVVIQSWAAFSSWSVVAHETLHLMGLPDLYRYSSTDLKSSNQFVGTFDVMGMSANASSPAMFAYERWILGWLDDSQVACQAQADATTPIQPVGSAGGINAVMVPTGTGHVVVVESRRRGPYSNSPKSGALVYLVDSTKSSGAGPIQVVSQLPDGDDEYMYSAPLMEGESAVVDGVTVSVVSASSSQDVVRIKRN